mmetsp:Transcript_16560/g.26245  ORF Transcript_16560/g.26245 Transcript_16560/m.26245 type:complete len:793 (-) Transcript_16560:79-2457(-)
MKKGGFVEDGYATLVFCLVCPVLAWIFSYIYYRHTARIIIDPQVAADSGLKRPINASDDGGSLEKIFEIYNLIFDGAKAFLFAEYRAICIFVVGFSIFILIVLGVSDSWINAIFTVIAFVVGCATSVLAGYVGMMIGTFANARTAVASRTSLAEGFKTAFKAAVVMGFCLCAFGIFNLYILIMLFRLYYSDAFGEGSESAAQTAALFEAIAGYGLGGSSVALFGRVGGGIYTKAADVGADLVGKVEYNLNEDDIRNPAVIADNVGDNVGDIAGMGADLFGSFAESSCAALVIAAQTGGLVSVETTNYDNIWENWGYVSFPLVISCTGIVASFITSFFATGVQHMELTDVEPKLKGQIMISTVIETIFLLIVSMTLMPEKAYFAGYVVQNALDHQIITVQSPIIVYNYYLFFSAAVGLWAGMGIGYVTEYYTSNQHKPTQVVAENCRTGAATNIIMGLALGYKSVIFPACAMAVAAYVSHSLAGFYGVALSALGILSTLSIGLTIDAFGPISDNAGGIAEMSDMPEVVRERTDCLDAAGNTTAAIGKGFAIGSAAFVSLALFSGYMTILQSRDVEQFSHVDILHAFPFAGLLVGAMIPYWFSAMTMGAVGKAAQQMVLHVRREFEEHPDILRPDPETNRSRAPNYAACIRISTEASLREMIPPGILVMGTPLVVGFIFGCKALAGVLIGALVSGVCGAVAASNTGGAWDNAKKFIEQNKLKNDDGEVLGKNTDAHKAAVVGDTVGDPLKDTSGPSLNIVMKLMAVESLVFAKAFYIQHPGFLGWISAKIKGDA